MKIVGLTYLHETIKPVVDLVFEEHKDCEIDTARLKQKGNSAEALARRHAQDLNRYLSALLKAIFASVGRCPTVMRAVLGDVRRAAARVRTRTRV